MAHVNVQSVPTVSDETLELRATAAHFATIIRNNWEPTPADIAAADAYLKYGRPAVGYLNGVKQQASTGVPNEASKQANGKGTKRGA